MRAGVPMIVVLVGLMASRAIGPTTAIRSDPPDRSAAAPEATANDNRAPRRELHRRHARPPTHGDDRHLAFRGRQQPAAHRCRIR
jgi:hypothetical protein